MREPPAPADDSFRRYESLRAALDLIDQGLTLIDSDLRFVAWNKTFLRLLDFPPEMGYVGAPFESFMRYNAERGEYGSEFGGNDPQGYVDERVRAARAFLPHEFERTRPNGTVLHVRGVPVPGHGFVTLYSDITAQKNAERQIREHNALLESRVAERTLELRRAQELSLQAQKMEALGQLTGGLAHDFNNILTVILGNLGALSATLSAAPSAAQSAARGNNAVVAEFVEPAVEAARRGAELIKALLSFSRTQPLQAQATDIALLIAAAGRLVRRSLPDSLRLDIEAHDAPLWAWIDGDQLHNAMLNLILNARDATPAQGRIDVHASAQVLDEVRAAELQIAPGGYVCIEVSDSGSGMDTRTQARMFEPFFTTKRAGQGSGLGLAMVYGFIKQSGGAIGVRSALGVGTTLSLWLPACQPGAELALPLPMDLGLGLGPGSGSDKNSADKGLALLVEDDPQVRTVVRRWLVELGFAVIEANNGNEAKQLLDQTPHIALLLTDVVMPGDIDGRVLAEHARAHCAVRQVVLMTGYEPDLGQASDMPLLAKPFTQAQLAALLDKAAP